MKSKRYYWIKLSTNFFEQETIDFLMSQKNGCAYIVLYQMLCLKTANTNGELSNTIGERLIPYDVNKIVRDTKYFDYDTVTVALELFKQLGLIYYQPDNNTLQIANYGDMVGSESESARRMRNLRQRQAAAAEALPSHSDEKVTESASQCAEEYRDKSIEYRDRHIDISTTTQGKTLNSVNKNKEGLDWSGYTEKELTETYPLNPEYKMTTAEVDMLYKLIYEAALERYLVKIQDYDTADAFRTIMQWAKQDLNIKTKTA